MQVQLHYLGQFISRLVIPRFKISTPQKSLVNMEARSF